MKEVICFGEVLWDLFPDGKKPGGAPMNVAYHLHKQGIKSTVISSVGNDKNGKALVNYLDGIGLDTRFIQVNDDLPTGTVDVLLDPIGTATYTIVKPVAWDAIHFDKAFMQPVENADAIVFGSLVCRDQESRVTLFKLLQHARLKVFDLNLRPPHLNTDLLDELLSQSDILKVNEEEFAFLTAHYKIVESGEQAFKQLTERFRIECLCITLGDKGAMVWHNNKLYSNPGYKVNVSDTVGSGDAFLAAFIKGYLNNQSIDDILTRACAIGAWVASRPGAHAVYTEEQVYQGFGISKMT
ncbi:MAG TPA: carbohydrate kinase [Sphingobacteriaceae bacterium]